MARLVPLPAAVGGATGSPPAPAAPAARRGLPARPDRGPLGALRFAARSALVGPSRCQSFNAVRRPRGSLATTCSRYTWPQDPAFAFARRFARSGTVCHTRRVGFVPFCREPDDSVSLAERSGIDSAPDRTTLTRWSIHGGTPPLTRRLGLPATRSLRRIVTALTIARALCAPDVAPMVATVDPAADPNPTTSSAHGVHQTCS